MKFDKESAIYILAIAAVMMFFMQPPQEQPVTPAVQTDAPSAATAEAKAAKPKKPASTLQAFSGQVNTVSLSNELTEVVINPVTGSIKYISLLKHFKEKGKPETIKLFEGAEKGALSIDQDGWALASKPSVKNSVDSLELTRKMFKGKQSFEITQNWKLKADYQLDYSVAVKNTSEFDLTIADFTVNAGTIQPLAKMTNVNVRIPETNIDYLDAQSSDFEKLSVGESRDDFPVRVNTPANFIAASNKFFAVILKPSTPFTNGVVPVGTFDKEDKVESFYAAGNYGNLVIAAAQSKTFDYAYYAGVKNQKFFAEFDEAAGDVMHLSSLGPLAFLSGKLIDALEFFKGITGSYGIAIILLTIIVRGLFWPITAKGTASMKKMQELQPLMKEIKEKYKDDQQQASMKTMELYREHKVNPVGGCLPMLVQIPIFMAFYWGIDGAVALRHVGFLWANDLAQPDVVGHILGLPIHPLVLIMASLMVVQQKMTPTTGDQMQKNMMMMMPIMMVFFMYGMPSGLTLYWSVSNTMSIIQLVATRKFGKNTNKAVTA